MSARDETDGGGPAHPEPVDPDDAAGPAADFWALLESPDTDAAGVVELVTGHVAEVVGEGSVLTAVSPDGTVLTPIAAYHPDPQVRDFMTAVLGRAPYRVDDGIAGSVVTSGTPIVLGAMPAPATESLMSAPSREFTAVYPIKAVMIVPLVDRGAVVGTLGVVRLASDEPYSADDLAVLTALADRVAGTVAGTRSEPEALEAADLEAIFRTSRDGVLVTHPDGRVVAANPAACRILGRSEAEICALGRAGLVVNDDLRARRAVEQRRIAGHVRAEIPMRRATGEVFVADVSSTVYRGADGGPRTVTLFRDVTEEAEQRAAWARQAEELERAAVTDELTGLWNRRGFTIAATHALALADRQGVPVQLLFIDVDGLKRVNDRDGHGAGDAVLAAVGRAIRSVVRDADASARIGGDEFVVLLYGTPSDQVAAVVARLEARLAADAGGPVELSIGVGARAPGDHTVLEELLTVADERMYAEKQRHHRGGSGRAP